MNASMIITKFRGMMTSPHLIFGENKYHLMKDEEEVFRVTAESDSMEELVPKLEELAKEEAKRRNIELDL